jgi:hypothetical protein
MALRAETRASIDALHAQIEALVAAEKAHHDATHPGEHSLHRQIAHTRIDVAARSPSDRSQMVWATASMPVLGGAAPTTSKRAARA